MADGFELIEHRWLPMADGVRLSARLWLPERPAGGRSPAVLELIPYRKRDAYRAADDAWGPVLAGAGIAFARVDVRGSGESEGVISDEYSEVELEDAQACIAWLATQDWCTGSVGMRGISWGGINTLAVAARQPPALQAIVPMAAAANRFTDDAHFIGGRIGKPNLDWGVLFKTVLAAPPDPEVVGPGWAELWQARLEATPAVVTEWLRHPTFDDYWQRASVDLDPAAIRVPAFLVAGWQDTYVNFVSSLLEQLDPRSRAIIGPWGHTYPGFAEPQGIDWAAEEVRFWQRWLLGDRSVDEPAPLRVYLPEATARQCHPARIPGSWHELATLPETAQQFVLTPDGLVAGDAAAGLQPLAEPLSWRESEPVGFAAAEWLDRLPEEQSRDDDFSLCFDSAPLEEALTLLGRASLTLELADVGGSVITARLCDVDEAGRSWLVGYATLDLRFCAGFDAAQPVAEASSVSLQFRLAGHSFRPGHRLRLALSGGLWPMTWPATTPLGFRLLGGGLTVPVLPPGTGGDSSLPDSSREGGRPPLPLSEVEELGDGRFRYQVEEPPYEYEVAEVGTALGGAGQFAAELGPGGQSLWRVTRRRSWRRGSWDCAVEATVTVERVGGGLAVEETLEAYRDGERVFERVHGELVADPDQ